MRLLHRLSHFFHFLTHRHIWAEREELGTFSMCRLLLPGCGYTIMFRPKFSHAAWHPVPVVRDDKGILLFERMMMAASAEEAMAMLRREMPD